MYSKSSSFPQNSTSGREFIIKRKFLKTAWILVSSEKLPSINCNSDWWARLLLTLNLLPNLIQQITQQTFVLMKTSWRRLSSSSSEDVFKTSWSRPIYSSCPYVFKTSSRHLQDVLKTFWRRLQAVKMYYAICLGQSSEKFMVSVENLQVW